MIKYDEFLEEYYWYWLNNIRNIGRRKISKLLKDSIPLRKYITLAQNI